MRALAIILLTANLALAAWLYMTHEPPVMPAPTPSLPAPPVVLADELPASLPPAQASDLETVPAAGEGEELDEVVLTCQALGPFQARDSATQASRQLVLAGLDPEMREVETSHRLGFWVFIPPAADRVAAGVHIDRLRQAGIRDFYLVADGENENAVSLGVFSTETAASQHAARLRALGFEVDIGERRRTLAAWWLDFAAPGPGSPGAAVVGQLVGTAGETLVLDARPCR